MPSVNPGEVWMTDFGMTAKVRPALLLTGNPGADELDLVTVILHTTSLRGNRWELQILKPFLKPGAFHLQANSYYLHCQTREEAWCIDQRGDESSLGCSWRSIWYLKWLPSV